MKSVVGAMVIGIVCGSAISQGIIHLYLKDRPLKAPTATESIRICGTFEAPSETPGSIMAEDFQMIITKDGAMIDPGPEDGVRLRICEEGE